MSAEITVSFNLQWLDPQTVWLLQIGGQVPIVFANVEMVLVDRNVVATISALVKEPGRVDFKAESWWLSHLDQKRFKLNPVLCAFEGRSRRPPTFDEFQSDLNQASNLLKQGLPNAEVLVHDSKDLDRVFATSQDFAVRRQAEEAFLLAIAPRLVNRPRRANAKYVEKDVFSVARDSGVRGSSLALIAALSCLYENEDGSHPRIGRGVIKPKVGYTNADAYNAVADLQSLLFLALASAFGGPSFGLVTRDKYLAAFWCALGITQLQLTAATFNTKMVIRPELFPCLNEEEVTALAARLDENSAS